MHFHFVLVCWYFIEQNIIQGETKTLGTYTDTQAFALLYLIEWLMTISSIFFQLMTLDEIEGVNNVPGKFQGVGDF